MALKQSQRFCVLEDSARNQEEIVTQAFAAALSKLKHSQTRLTDLERYLSDYSIQKTANQAISVTVLLNRREFVEKLQTAVRQQVLEVERCRQEVENVRAQLLHASRQSQTMQHIVAGYRATENKISERRVQQNLDEIASRLCVATARARETENQ